MVNPFKDTNWNPDIAARRSFAKSIAIGFPVLALVLSVPGWIETGALPTWAPRLAAIGAAAGAVLWIAPQIARPLYLIWFFAACCIGLVVSNLLLASFYYMVITPLGLIMRVLGRDPMKRSFDRTAITYWKDSENPIDPKRYFRQF